MTDTNKPNTPTYSSSSGENTTPHADAVSEPSVPTGPKVSPFNYINLDGSEAKEGQ